MMQERGWGEWQVNGIDNHPTWINSRVDILLCITYIE